MQHGWWQALKLGIALAALLATGWLQPLRAQGVVVTLIDGEAALVDGTRRAAAAAGVRLAPGTLIDTAAGTAILRLELPDRSIVDLGPATRAMLLPPGFAPRAGQAPLLYLLSGWAKITGPDKGTAAGLVTPAFELLPFSGAAVVSAGRAGASAFAEGGAIELADRSGPRRTLLPAGALLDAGAQEPRPTPAWLGRVPRAFRDPLPRRAASFAERPVAAAALPGPTYAQLADWLAAEPALRRAFVRRFEPLAQEPAFRRELAAHLSSHPEWGRVLYPPDPQKP